MDYEYNIRGWLCKINDPATFTENDKLGIQLYYNTAPTGGTALCNGNISGMQWGTPTSPLTSGLLYRFSYDNMNRLTGADFDKTGYATNAFDCSYGYNANGNFTSINRRKSDGSYIDQLSFGYVGNQIDYIDDSSLDIANVVDYPGALYGTYAFEYDYNGNMSYEPYKEISLAYNLINLPYEADFGSNRKINYFYTFDGTKLRQTVEDNGTITKTDYCGPFVYETVSGVRSLKYLITTEGRAVKNGSTWEYEYNLKDHLGNTRAVIKNNSGVAQLIQERHYYPYGMEMSELSSGTSTNKFLYNSKEHQNDFELDWYDYGARFYDPELGRWHSIDNKAEKYAGNTSYAYALNNPIKFIDPNGNDVYLSIKNQAHMNALQNFMSTKEGQRFIGQFAGKGQTVNGVYYDKAGNYSNINLSINSKDINGAFGETKSYLSNSPKGRLQLRNMLTSRDLPNGKRKFEIDINLRNGDSSEQSTYTLGHEAFVHAENNAEELNQIETDVKNGTIDSETKLVSKTRNVEMNANEEHSNLVTGGTNENTKMNSYVNDLNKNSGTNIYNQYYEDDKKKY